MNSVFTRETNITTAQPDSLGNTQLVKSTSRALCNRPCFSQSVGVHIWIASKLLAAGCTCIIQNYVVWTRSVLRCVEIENNLKSLTVFVAVALDPATRGTFVTWTEKYSVSIKGHAPWTTHVWRSSVNVFKCGSPNKAHKRKSCGFRLICSLDGLVCMNVKFKQAGCLWPGATGVFVVGRAVPFVGSETFPQLWSFICRGISVIIVRKCMSELQLFTAFWTSWTQRKKIANAVQIGRLVSGSAASTALLYGAMHRSFNTWIHCCPSADTRSSANTNKIASNVSVFIFTGITTQDYTLPKRTREPKRATIIELYSRCGNRQIDSSTWKTAVSPSLNRNLMSLLHGRLNCRT